MAFLPVKKKGESAVLKSLSQTSSDVLLLQSYRSKNTCTISFRDPLEEASEIIDTQEKYSLHVFLHKEIYFS